MRSRTLLLVVLISLFLAGCATTNLPELEAIQQQQVAQDAYLSGDLHLAEGLWRRAIKRNSQLQHLWCKIGHVNFRLHEYEAAFQAYQRCLADDREQPIVWRNLAAVRLRQATELLLIGHKYLVTITAPETQQFRSDYERLMKQLLSFHRAPTALRPAHDNNEK